MPETSPSTTYFLPRHFHDWKHAASLLVILLFVALISGAYVGVPNKNAAASGTLLTRIGPPTTTVIEDINYIRAKGTAQVSQDGRYVVFATPATNVIDDDNNGKEDVFLYDRTADIYQIISVDGNGTQGNNHSFLPSISADGRFVSFSSDATNLVPGDTNGATDIFVYDVQNFTIERASVSTLGTQGNSVSGVSGVGDFGVIHGIGSRLSADGRYVVFDSSSSNLVSGASGGQVYLRDRQNHTTELVSTSTAGLPGDAASDAGSVSGDGRYVVFRSDATNFDPADTNAMSDIYIHDRTLGKTWRINVTDAGVQANERSYSPFISENGNFIAYTSRSTNLVADDTNGAYDVFVFDRNASTTEIVSRTSAGVLGDGLSGDPYTENMGQPGGYSESTNAPQLSADGRYVVFASRSLNLVPGLDFWGQVYKYDRNTDTIAVQSVNNDGELGDRMSLNPSISADGSTVIFMSKSTNLDTTGVLGSDSHSYFQDMYARVGSNTSIVTKTGVSTRPLLLDDGILRVNAMSTDGRYIALQSKSYNIFPFSSTNDSEIYVFDRNDNTFDRVSIAPNGDQAEGDDGPATSEMASMSSDGSLVAFQSNALNFGGGSIVEGIYVYDRNADILETLTAPAPSNGLSSNAIISPNGRYVAFRSAATNLVGGDSNGVADTFIYDRNTDTLSRVYAAAKGFSEYTSSSTPQGFSTDGRYLVLNASKSGGATPSDVFVYDQTADSLQRVSVTVGGAGGNNTSTDGAISSDGRYVAFSSLASDLVSGSTNSVRQVYVFDKTASTSELISKSDAGGAGDAHSYLQSMSADGRFVLYSSTATNLVAGGAGSAAELYIFDRQSQTVKRVSDSESGQRQNNMGVISGVISPDGSLIAFGSYATNLLLPTFTSPNALLDKFPVFDSVADPRAFGYFRSTPEFPSLPQSVTPSAGGGNFSSPPQAPASSTTTPLPPATTTPTSTPPVINPVNPLPGTPTPPTPPSTPVVPVVSPPITPPRTPQLMCQKHSSEEWLQNDLPWNIDTIHFGIHDYTEADLRAVLAQPDTDASVLLLRQLLPALLNYSIGVKLSPDLNEAVQWFVDHQPSDGRTLPFRSSLITAAANYAKKLSASLATYNTTNLTDCERGGESPYVDLQCSAPLVATGASVDFASPTNSYQASFKNGLLDSLSGEVTLPGTNGEPALTRVSKFLDQYKAAFGIENSTTDLKLTKNDDLTPPAPTSTIDAGAGPNVPVRTRVGESVTITAKFTPGRGDALMATAINFESTGNSVPCSALTPLYPNFCWQQPDPVKTFTFTPTEAGTYVFSSNIMVNGFVPQMTPRCADWNCYDVYGTVTVIVDGAGATRSCADPYAVNYPTCECPQYFTKDASGRCVAPPTTCSDPHAIGAPYCNICQGSYEMQSGKCVLAVEPRHVAEMGIPYPTRSVMEFQRMIGEYPVFGSSVSVAVNPRQASVYKNIIYALPYSSYSGAFVGSVHSTLPIDTSIENAVVLSPRQAIERGLASTSATTASTTLVVFNPGLLKSCVSPNRLAYQVNLTSVNPFDPLFRIIDAGSGSILYEEPGAYDFQNITAFQGSLSYVGTTTDAMLLRGQTIIDDQPPGPPWVHDRIGDYPEGANLYLLAGVAYNFFMRQFLRDGMDDRGGPTSVIFATSSNAFISGLGAYAIPADNGRPPSITITHAQFLGNAVVTHEWGHGVLFGSGITGGNWIGRAPLKPEAAAFHEGYSDLFAWWQSPALNYVLRVPGSYTGQQRDAKIPITMKDFKSGDKAHENGMIIAHAAYLAARGGQITAVDGKKIDIIAAGEDVVSQIYYAALEKLPRVPTFSDLASALYTTALNAADDGFLNGRRVTYKHCGAILNGLAGVGLSVLTTGTEFKDIGESSDRDHDCYPDFHSSGSEWDNCKDDYNPTQDPRVCDKPIDNKTPHPPGRNGWYLKLRWHSGHGSGILGWFGSSWEQMACLVTEGTIGPIKSDFSFNCYDYTRDPQVPTPAKLTIVTHVVNDDKLPPEDEKKAEDFIVHVLGRYGEIKEVKGSEAGVVVEFHDGPFMVLQDAMPHYTKKISEFGCMGTLEEGDTVTCEILNNDISPDEGGDSDSI